MLENPQITTLDPQHTAVVRRTVPMDQIRDFYDTSFAAVARAVAEQEVGVRGAIGHYLSTPTDTVELEAGVITDGAITADGDVIPAELPGGEVAHATHVGPYDGLGSAWNELYQWVLGQGRHVGEKMWEVYVTEPTPEVDPATMRTDLFWPLV
ncbi:GyrI-like domain-containing protein [Tessaracoccus sp. SD287]|uniref:GyrI-like domain-containing protein n=1 Tax=Tessaracoccus sp. SD287 TaxID=2782008 RepID=UPI001A9637A3|nr:GyrI-like domain-containing protein [Tessaracoccus sp. SD287]MBO1031154.1 GyrI-like domain-containing protein [Tessaracoccus sp. SD287]